MCLLCKQNTSKTSTLIYSINFELNVVSTHIADMAEPSGGENEWELSKENVQPLRSGRRFANLSAALQPHAPDVLAKLKEERK